MSEFQIRKKKNVVSEDTVEVYTFFGKHDYEDDEGYPMLDFEEEIDLEQIFEDPEAYAVKTNLHGVTRYYVKRGKHGHLFNPIGMYSEGTQHKQLRHAGKPLWELKKTSKKIFDYYINFLKTKNPAWLNNAEREV